MGSKSTAKLPKCSSDNNDENESHIYVLHRNYEGKAHCNNLSPTSKEKHLISITVLSQLKITKQL
jgi:hypothetical protein